MPAHRRLSFAFAPPCIPHAVAVIVTSLAFHTEDPNGGWGALNIFLFPDLPPSAGSEAALLARKWDAILGGGILTSFADTSLLAREQKASPIAGGYKATSQPEASAVFCAVFLVDAAKHPATFKMFLLVE